MLIKLQVTSKQGASFNCPDGQITAEMLQNSQGQLLISAMIPIVDITSVWHPDLMSIPAVKLPWQAEFTCGMSKSYPLFAFMNQMSHVSCCIGLTNCIDDCLASARMNQELCCYEVKFVIAVSSETEPFAVFSDQSKRSLGEVLQDYRQLVMPAKPQYPAGAWNPVYCTWYAVHAAITEEYLISNAQAAAELGFGTFIVDDGWCLDENKRVTPLTLPDWYRDIGDWQCSKSKLPNMKSIVDQARQLGLNYMFWVAPFFAGRRSKLTEKVSKFLTGLHEGQRIFDPADEWAVQDTQESIYNIFRQMNLDGIKIDFIDSVEPDVDHPHCREVKRYMEKLVTRIRQDKPEALIEFRQKYSTPVNAHLATAFRAGDVPFDYMENFSRSVQLRLHMGDGVPVHADPVYFNNAESVDAVGRHMIAALAGVPMLSMELSTISSEHKAVIKNYIDFYNNHRQLLNFGHWFVEIRSGFTAWVKCRNADKTVIIITDEALLDLALRDCSGAVTVLNLTPGKLDCRRGCAFDAVGNACGRVAPSGGRLELA